MVWVPNKKLKMAILKRLSFLLDHKNPTEILEEMVEEKARHYPAIDPVKDYSVLEDLCIQDIILKYQDHMLDTLWASYNFGYFLEDTYIKKKEAI